MSNPLSGPEAQGSVPQEPWTWSRPTYFLGGDLRFRLYSGVVGCPLPAWPNIVPPTGLRGDWSKRSQSSQDMCPVWTTRATRKHTGIPVQVEMVRAATESEQKPGLGGGRGLKADGERGKRIPRETSRKSGCLSTD